MRSAVLSCLLLLFAAPLHAAEPADEAATANESASESDAAPGNEADADIDVAVAEEIRAAEEAAANAAPADPNESFVPTVQISEDLSVSFPVDI